MKLPKTLAEAREVLATFEAENATLSARVNELMSDELSASLGLEKIEVEGKTSFKNALAEKLTADHVELANRFAANEALLKSACEGEYARSEELSAALETIKTLEAEKLSVSAQAREMLAAQGAAPLPVDASDSVAELTIPELQQALATEKDPSRQTALYNQLKDKRRKN